VAAVLLGYLPAAVVVGAGIGWFVVWPVLEALARIMER
jgi:hypothetical protein